MVWFVLCCMYLFMHVLLCLYDVCMYVSLCMYVCIVYMYMYMYVSTVYVCITYLFSLCINVFKWLNICTYVFIFGLL